MKAEERKLAKVAFLASLQVDPTISPACEVAQISRDTAYRWREQDGAFSKAWDTAVERTRDVARSSIYRRGILGWDEPLVSMGQPVYLEEPVLDEDGRPKLNRDGGVLTTNKLLTVHRWSDTLAVTYAKANLPEYKEKPQVNINAQLTDLAEQAKAELLADLAASLGHEDQLT